LGEGGETERARERERCSVCVKRQHLTERGGEREIGRAKEREIERER